jgi:hypothetical protein
MQPERERTMPITELDEERAQRVAERQRQDKKTPLLISEDGRLYPNTKLMRANPRYRPYHGSPKASLEDRKRYLLGLGAKRAVQYEPEPEEAFDIGKASVEALLEFAQEQYGIVLDPNKPPKMLREEVYRLSQLPDPSLALPAATGQAPADDMPEVLPSPAAIAAVKPEAPAVRGGRQPRRAAKAGVGAAMSAG